MIARELMTSKYVDNLLDTAITRVEFGNVVMGIVEDAELGLVAIGRRRVPRAQQGVFHILELLGPATLANAMWHEDARYLLESLLNNAELMGVSGRVGAILVDACVLFDLFAEGLIVLDSVVSTRNGLVEFQVVLFEDEVYKLLVSETRGVLNLGNAAVLVDKNMIPVP